PGIPKLPHLATFVKITERRNFTTTTEVLEITQTAVSQRIAALEKELRTSLFDRRQNGLRSRRQASASTSTHAKSSICTNKHGGTSVRSARSSPTTCRSRPAPSPANAFSQHCYPSSMRPTPKSTCGPQ